MNRPIRAAAVAITLLLSLGACGDGGESVESVETGPDDVPALVSDLRRAVEAVEADRGSGQEYFEVTATPQLTNVFVAIEDASAAVPYVFVDGVLEGPAPKLDGASGFTFRAADIDPDDAILDGVATELPEATVLGLSVEGATGGFVRYVVSAQSAQGGVLDIEVTRTGSIIAVEPL